ncbi:3-keto-disaccharide hydrolase [Rhodospirillum centenum]|uniref:Glycosyl hydrolase, putative n=1 Tax=Rhodospirillum centenum (strain ATCC 51521 / SW) TaxID=414684 RepID=B6IRT7_RHOCS|nr:DUF1080 domain-containing protein [Rhodospirillum centenum]ACI98173.1 glycosyl hydrolase, putative [Rhodospirillum centenum SW]
MAEEISPAAAPSPVTDSDLEPLLAADLDGWQMAGQGRFFWAADGILESEGGPGIFWYADSVYADFLLRVDWRTRTPEDNSGVFLRLPPLAHDLGPALRLGYEVQIDDRGIDPEANRSDCPLHLTGAVYRQAPAQGRLSRPVGAWNRFDITFRGPTLCVWLNGAPVSRLDRGNRRPEGHVGLQAHHPGSRVQFRNLRIARL